MRWLKCRTDDKKNGDGQCRTDRLDNIEPCKPYINVQACEDHSTPAISSVIPCGRLNWLLVSFWHTLIVHRIAPLDKTFNFTSCEKKLFINFKSLCCLFRISDQKLSFSLLKRHRLLLAYTLSILRLKTFRVNTFAFRPTIPHPLVSNYGHYLSNAVRISQIICEILRFSGFQNGGMRRL